MGELGAGDGVGGGGGGGGGTVETGEVVGVHGEWGLFGGGGRLRGRRIVMIKEICGGM